MKIHFRLVVTALLLGFGFLGLTGCAERHGAHDSRGASKQDGAADAKPAPSSAKEQKIGAARAKLDPADRALVEEQEFCPVMPKQKLGSMGVPVKVVVKGQPVFLCCKGCKSSAEEDADETLRAVEGLKAKNKTK